MNDSKLANRNIPTIAPVAGGIPRPLWSVMIPTFNCANYLRETLASVLAQDPGADVMQIMVVDDCSTKDDPAAIVAELGQGRVEFYQQPHNVGHTHNFNTCIQCSRGRLVHILHGDDLVRDGFYHTIERAFEIRPDIGAAFCRHIFVDSDGHWQSISRLERQTSGVLNDWLEQIAVGQRLQTPSIVVRRAVYEQIGGFYPHVAAWGEDWEMWTRIAASYPVWYEVQPLACYRLHTGSLSRNGMRSGQDLRDAVRLTRFMQTYLPAHSAPQLVRQAREACVLGALRRTLRALNADNFPAFPTAQIYYGIKCSQSPRVLAHSLLLIARWFAHAVSRRRVSYAHG